MKIGKKQGKKIGDMNDSHTQLKKKLANIKSSQDIADVIKLTRVALGYTQADFAAKIGTDNTTLSRWERGLFLPSLSFQQSVNFNHELNKLGFNITDIPFISVVLETKDLKMLNFVNQIQHNNLT
jgi:DNA-binding XRE family transcriptional regulator